MAVGPGILGGVLMLAPSVSSIPLRDQRVTASCRLLLTIFTLLFFTLPALAQSTAGRILGTVTDQSSAAVAGATVVVTDTQRGISRTLTTDEAAEQLSLR